MNIREKQLKREEAKAKAEAERKAKAEAEAKAEVGRILAAVIATLSREKKAGDRKIWTVDGIEYAFRWCPAGTFTMGSPSSVSNWYDEGPHFLRDLRLEHPEPLRQRHAVLWTFIIPI